MAANPSTISVKLQTLLRIKNIALRLLASEGRKLTHDMIINEALDAWEALEEESAEINIAATLIEGGESQ